MRNPHHVAITGASSGIGAALARHYAKPGMLLSLLARDSARLDEVARHCRDAGSDVHCQTVDVRDRDGVQQWLFQSDDVQPIDMLVANAGIGGKSAVTRGMTETAALASEIVEINLIGIMNTVAPMVPRFVDRKRGQIAILSSLAGFLALPDAPAYCASKAAIRVYGHALRRLLAPHNVGVTVVCPGFVETPMSASLEGSRPFLWSSAKAAQRIARDVARGRKESSFPFPLATAAYIGASLPSALMDRLLAYRRQRPGR